MSAAQLVSPLTLFNNEAVIVEMMVAQALFALQVPKKPCFKRRLVVAIPALLLFTALLAIAFYGGHALIRIGVLRSVTNFLLLYLAANVAATAVLDCGAHVVMSISICGYAVQHIASACTSLGHLAREALPFAPLHTWLAGELLRIMMFVAVYVACHLCFIRRFDVMRMRVSSNASLLFLALSMLGVTLGLSSYASVGTHAVATSFVFRSVSILVCVMILLMFGELSRNHRLTDELAFMKRMNDMRTNYYELLKDTIDTTNVHYHDLKHQVARLRTTVNEAGGTQASNAMLDEISQSVSAYGSIAKTGNAALDVVLTQKNLECDRKNIRFTYMFDAGCLDDVSDYDIYSLFGNALDNAIEACEKLADEERRVIKLTGVMRGRLASINIVNYFDELDRNGQGEIITTKSDKTSHGYGLKSIRMIVARLGGDMSVTTENGIFDVSIMLPKS